MIKKHLFLKVVFLVTISCLNAQPYSIDWQKSLGGSSSSETSGPVIQTSDGGYIVIASTYSTDGDVVGNNGNQDAWVVKLNAAGAIQWQKPLGGTSDDSGYSITETYDGSFVLAGYIDGYSLVKLDASGDVIWQSNDLVEAFESIHETSDSGFIVAGITFGGGPGNYDVLVAKFDSLGNLEWQQSMGGSGQDIGWGVIQTNDGGYIMSGYHATSGLWVVKLTSAGSISWQKFLGGLDGGNIQQTNDGGYIVAGGRSFRMVKLTSSGATTWDTKLGGSDPGYFGYYANCYYVLQHDDGGYVGCGSTGIAGSDYWLVKLDANGNLVYQKQFGGGSHDYGSHISSTDDGGFIMSGDASSNNGDVSGNHGGYDIWVVKVSNNATSWTGGAGNSNWSDPANWSSGVVPASTEDLVISYNASGIYPVLTGTSNIEVNELYIEEGASLTLNFPVIGGVPQAELIVNKVLTNNGNANLGTGYLRMKGNSITGNIEVGYLKTNGNVWLATGGNIAVKNELALVSGTLNVKSASLLKIHRILHGISQRLGQQQRHHQR